MDNGTGMLLVLFNTHRVPLYFATSFCCPVHSLRSPGPSCDSRQFSMGWAAICGGHMGVSACWGQSLHRSVHQILLDSLKAGQPEECNEPKLWGESMNRWFPEQPEVISNRAGNKLWWAGRNRQNERTIWGLISWNCCASACTVATSWSPASCLPSW